MNNIRSYEEFAKETYIYERIEEISNAITKSDTEYKQWVHKENMLFEKLNTFIPKRDQDLLYEYSTTMFDKFSRLIDLLVEQVIKDIGRF